MTVGDLVRRAWLQAADPDTARAEDVIETASWHLSHAGDGGVPETLPLQLLAELAEAVRSLAGRVRRLEHGERVASGREV